MGGGGRCCPLVLDYAPCGGGAEWFGDLDETSSCWELVLWEDVILLVGLSGRGGSWS